MVFSAIHVKQGLSAFAGSLGYSLKRRRSAAAAMFAAMCDLKAEGSSTPDELELRFVDLCRRSYAISRAQRFQDVLADFIMDGKPGIFCEFGATDGLSLSNTAMLEEHRGWTGVLAEPGRQWREDLLGNRPAAAVDTRCVFSRSGESLVFAESPEGEYSGIPTFQSKDAHVHRRKQVSRYEVSTVSLNDLLDEHGISRLDYLSVDTEGSELAILEPFDFDRFAPKLITVEHNYSAARERLYELITGAGYRRIFAELSGFDDWFVRQD